MGRKSRSRKLVVGMNGLAVGDLERLSGGQLRFRYRAEWLERETALPISLSMPLSSAPFAGDVVWSFLDNLLPDSRDLRERMRRVVGAESTRPFDLLAAVGRDCVGALQLSGGEDLPDVRRVEADPLSEAEIAAVLRDVRAQPLGMSRDRGDFRISLAGAQEKTALLWHQERWQRPHGATPTSHILKLPIGPAQHGIDLTDSVENEWLCLELAHAFGLQVAQARMQIFDGVRALVVQRFDRQWATDGSWLIRLPQEDFCQALGLPPGERYEADGGPGIRESLDLLLQSEEPTIDRRNFYQAQIVFWLLAAIDGHGKNFSLFLHPGGRCRATPLYDVLSAWPVVARKDLNVRELAMAMAVSGKNRHYRWKEIQPRHWISTAQAAGFSPREAAALLDETLALVPGVLESVSAALPPDFPEHVATPIFEALRAAGHGG